jgi:hypothetical protein
VRLPVTGPGTFAAGVVLLLTALSAVPMPLASATPARAAIPAGAVTMTVRDVSPHSPVPSRKPHQLVVSLVLVNNTAHMLKNVVVSAARSDPIPNKTALDSAIAKPKSPTSSLVAPLDPIKTVTLAPGGVPMDLVYQTSIGSDPGTADLCLCANAIYPLYFTADYTPPGAASQQLAVAQTYIPSFATAPTKAQVSWVWPLLDRPHRLLSDRLFLDDDLAAEVAPGGRLDQLLAVVEKVGRTVPMTLLIDPELIDELAVMSTRYEVQTPTGPVRGQGGSAAATWLARLRTVLKLPGMELSFTPYADPPVESLQQAGLTWKIGLPTTSQQTRVTRALGATPTNDIAWPANQTISSGTLSTLIGEGTNTFILNDRTLPKGRDEKLVPSALAPVNTTTGTAVAAVTSAPLEHWVQTVLDPDGPGLTALPELVSQLAVRVEASPQLSHYIVLTPSRDLLTVDPTVAERTILETAHTIWSRPLPIRAAESQVEPVDHGALHPQRPPRLPTRVVTRLRYVLGSVTGLGTLFHDQAKNEAISRSLPIGVLRTESTALLDQPALATSYATRLSRHVRRIRNNVVLVPPLSGGNYTLASKNSRIPVTITNRLPDEVEVLVGISGAIGFSSDPVDKLVPANSTVQVRVPTHVDRVGLFYVQVGLSTKDGLSLSTPLQLTVHSTALGTVGVVITITAAVVLVAALLIRFIRRMRRRGPPTAPETVPPVPAATATP